MHQQNCEINIHNNMFVWKAVIVHEQCFCDYIYYYFDFEMNL